MEELRKINRHISIKQIVRIVLGTGFTISGMIMLLMFAFQNGIILEQEYLSERYPEEYKQMVKKTLKLFEK